MTVVTLLVIISVAIICVPSVILRVYQGDKDVTSKYPFVVRLEVGVTPLDRICSGSLLTPNWVLTAAHCTVGTDTIKYVKHGNTTALDSEEEEIMKSLSEVVKMIPHPRYSPPFATNDIALLLVNPVNITRYACLSAVDYQTLFGQSVEYAGFGSSYIPKEKDEHKIIKMLVDYFRPMQIGAGVVKACSGVFFTDNYICLGFKCSRKQTPLGGDSGGPLFLDHKIIGITTQGIEAQFEQAFTPVSPYLTWIHDDLRSFEVCCKYLLRVDTVANDNNRYFNNI